MPHKDKELEKDTPISPDFSQSAQEDTAAENTPQDSAVSEGEAAAELLEKELGELKDLHLRLTAEYDNYRKRTAREREGIYSSAQAEVLTAFLTVADNFDRAMEAPCSDADFKKGMELIHSGFSDVLERLGVTKFAQVGDHFDPECHSALAQVESEDAEPGTITQVYTPGYRLGDKVLRPAAVVVAG